MADLTFLLVLFLLFFCNFDCSVSLMIANGEAVDNTKVNPSKVTKLSLHPRVFLYEGFLSTDECDHLISLAKDGLTKSTVLNDDTGVSSIGEERTSSDKFLNYNQDEIVGRIERRIATWTFLPEENGEGIQVLRYEKGEKFEPHLDYFYKSYSTTQGGNRLATVVMYLSDVQKGGETVFPAAEGRDLQEKDDSWSGCGKSGYAVKPKKGDALLFFSLHPNTTGDSDSLHAGCPVLEGVKWSATKWIHVNKFSTSPADDDDVGRGCHDKNDDCPQWASQGECEKNAAYMVKSCRKSCKLCGED